VIFVQIVEANFSIIKKAVKTNQFREVFSSSKENQGIKAKNYFNRNRKKIEQIINN
jgi:hypothetical protein